MLPAIQENFEIALRHNYLAQDVMNIILRDVNESNMRADSMIRECRLVLPDKHEEWEYHHKNGSGICQEELRFCGDRNYEMFLLLTIIWSQPTDPLEEDYNLIRKFNNVLPTSFGDEVFSIKQQELDYDELIQASSTHITKSNPKFNVLFQ